MNNWCAAFNHKDGGMIGVALNVTPTDKQNKAPRALRGLMVLRQCKRCDQVYTRSGMADLVGLKKVPVHYESSILFVESCKNGCAPEELFVRSHHLVIVAGCTFCGRETAGGELGGVLKAWEESNI